MSDGNGKLPRRLDKPHMVVPIQPGEVRNPKGHNQYTYRRDFERTVDRLLSTRPSPHELAALGYEDEFLESLPRTESGAIDMTRGELWAHRKVWQALRGTDAEGMLKRAFPERTVLEHELPNLPEPLALPDTDERREEIRRALEESKALH